MEFISKTEKTASGLEIPDHGRDGFLPALNILHDKIKAGGHPQLVEIGSQRDWEMGNGCSTNLLAWFCKNYGAGLYTVDIDIEFVEKLIESDRGYDERVFVLEQDGVEFFKSHTCEIYFNTGNPIDFLYLDAWDYGPTDELKQTSANEHLRCFMLAERWLADDALVLIDDVLNHEDYDGKGKYIIPYLLDNNYELIHKSYQYLFRRQHGKI